MINVGIVTNIRSPYRKMQFEEFALNKNYNFNVYYTEKNYIGRKWKVDKINGVNENKLKGFDLFKLGRFNFDLRKIVKENEVIIIGGYEKPTYIFLSILSRIYKKPYIILYDGISPIKIEAIENKAKLWIKKLVIKHASAFFANGKCGRDYFVKKFNIPKERIFNQYLTVDVNQIKGYGKKRELIRKEIRKDLKIHDNAKVIIYSGRLIKLKKVDNIIRSIGALRDKENYHLLIFGDGEERGNLQKMADEYNVKMNILGFFEQQEELFKMYYVGDLLILNSVNEVWGLVVNEAMAAGLPIIVTNECGCASDLVKNNHNGFIIKSNNNEELSDRIQKIFSNTKINYRENSLSIISNWTFSNSKRSFEDMLKQISI